jgi:NDP-sugar pyrophosphorylase family protein
MPKRDKLPVQAVIMAGGLGMRMRPLTEHTPKPLLEVNGRPILAYVLDRLNTCGVRDVVISLNYLGDQIEARFGDGQSDGLDIRYCREDKPLGTFGALSLLDRPTADAVLIMNSDLLTNLDFAEFYRRFVESGADFAIGCMTYPVHVPYGVFETDGDGRILGVHEKPTYTYLANGGIYLLKTELLELIPVDQRFDATDFINMAVEKNFHLLAYPLHCYWRDIGKMEDFAIAQEEVKGIQF